MSKFEKALKKIAKMEGISVREVYREMQAAIDAGYASQSPAVQAAWSNVPLPYGKPRPEDVFAYCLKQIEA